MKTTACALLLCAGPLAGGGGFEDPGPHPAGWQAVTFVSGSTIKGRVYYPALSDGEGAPADPGPAGYPLVGLIHGQTFAPADYDLLSLHLASHGFVVCSVGPLAGPLHAPPSAAGKMQDMLEWFTAESASPASPFAGLAGDAPWAVMGHSLGGSALAHIVELEPKVRSIVGLAPYYSDDPGLPLKLAAFSGANLSVAGAVDIIVPAAEHAYPFYLDASHLGRSVFVEIEGTGHYGSLDAWILGVMDPVPWEEQHRVHRKVVTAFLLAQSAGLEDSYVAILGEGGASEPFARECSSADPPLWVVPSELAHGLAVGLGGRPDDPAWIAISAVPASIDTRAGTLGLDPAGVRPVFVGDLGPEGCFEILLSPHGVPAGQAIHVQGLAVHPEEPVLSRTATFVVP